MLFIVRRKMLVAALGQTTNGYYNFNVLFGCLSYGFVSRAGR